MIGIGGTGLLARDTENRIHVVVTHVCSLGSNVFGAHGDGKSLLVHCCAESRRVRIGVRVWFRVEVNGARNRSGLAFHRSFPSRSITVVGYGCVFLELTEWNIAQSRNGSNSGEDNREGTSLAELGDQSRSASTLNVVTTTVKIRSRTTRRGFVPNFYHCSCVYI